MVHVRAHLSFISTWSHSSETSSFIDRRFGSRAAMRAAISCVCSFFTTVGSNIRYGGRKSVLLRNSAFQDQRSPYAVRGLF